MAERTLTVKILGDSRALRREFERSSRATSGFGRDVSRLGRGALVGTGALGSLGRAAAFASTAFIGGAGLTLGITKSIQAASDLNEEVNKTRVVFRGSSRQILAWSKQSATAFGLSRQEALGAVGAFGAMLNTSGVATDKASQMSRAMVQLAADMASFNNQDPSEMLDRLRSGLAGEAEPLRRFGVLLSESRVQQEAVRSGLSKAGAKLTEQQKVLARYNLVLRDTGLQQGDFARTSGGLANQMRILRGQIQNLLASIGTALLPIVLRLVRQLNAWLANSKNQARVQRAVVQAVNFTVEAITSVVKAVQDVKQALQDMSRFGKRVWIELQAGAVKAALGIIEPFSRLPSVFGAQFRKDKAAFLKQLAGLKDDFAALGADSATAFASGFKSRFADVGPGMTLDLPTGTTSALAGGGIGGAARRTGATSEQRNAWFDAAIGRQIDRVQDITSLQGQLADLRRIANLIQQRINITKDVTRKLTLEDQLVSVQRDQRNVLQAIRDRTRQLAEERKALEQEQRERALVARNARQFLALGLAATGEERVPGLKGLRRQLGNFSEAVEGTFLDTRKTRSILSRIRRVLSGGLGAVSRDVREKIAAMLADLNRQLKDQASGPLTKFQKASANALLAGLGLSPDQVRALRSRLSQIGAGGTVHPGGFGAFGVPLSVSGGTIVLQHSSTLDGNVLERSTTTYQQKRRRRNPTQKRGVVSP